MEHLGILSMILYKKGITMGAFHCIASLQLILGDFEWLVTCSPTYGKLIFFAVRKGMDCTPPISTPNPPMAPPCPNCCSQKLVCEIIKMFEDSATEKPSLPLDV